MKTKKLLMMLSAMAAMVAGSSTKAETEKKDFPFTNDDVQQILFKQDELARIPVNGAYVSIMKGWQGQTVTTNKVTGTAIVDGQEQEVTYNKEETVNWTAPFITHDGKVSSGFAKAWSDDTVGFLTNGISTVTVNPDNGKMYVFENHDQSHDHFWELNMNTNSITATEPLKILSQLNPGAKEVPFYSENSETSQKMERRVDKAFAWGVGAGEFIVTYKSSGKQNTTIWHRNDVVHVVPATVAEGNVADVDPQNVTFGDSKVYVSNGTNLYSMDKEHPEDGYEMVSNVSASMTYGIVGDNVYQVKADGFYVNGVVGDLYRETSDSHSTDFASTPSYLTPEIEQITGSNDGVLVVAHNADEEKVELAKYRFTTKNINDPEEKVDLRNETPVIAVAGAKKIISAKDGVIKVMTKAGQEKVLTYTKE